MTASKCPVFHGFDPYGERYLEDPYPVFKEVRDASPVAYVPELDVYVVGRYDDVSAVLLDRDTFRSEGVTSSNFSPVCPEAQAILDKDFHRKPTLTNADPPHHTLMRNAVAQCLTPRRWAASQPAVREYATGLVDALVKKPVADLQADLAYPLPAFAGFALLGFPREDTDMIKSWCVHRVLMTYGRLDPETQVVAAREMAEFWRYVEAFVDRRMTEPADDLTTDLVAVLRKSNGAITREHLVNILYSTSLAAHETTQNSMLNGLRRLLEQRDQWELLCNDPKLIPAAVEELLRYDNSAISLRRKAARDTEIGGVPIPAGAIVLVLNGGANRDPSHFAEPDKIDVRRANAREHLSFGKQWHFCLGAPLARFEYTLALQLLTSKAPNMRLVPGQKFDYHALIQLRAMQHLYVEPNAGATT